MLRLSLFLDIDGTLLDLASHPDKVTVPAALPRLLQRLDTHLKGALAMVSGRNIAAIDRLLSPYKGVAIGVHGFERRERDGSSQTETKVLLPDELRQGINDIVERHPGAFIEDKGCAIAVHERGGPAAAILLADSLSSLCGRIAPAWGCLRGHRVVEIKPAGADKGTGVDLIMQHEPFAGTLPIALGDDITDLDMFATVTRLGGMTIAVGDRISNDGQLQLRSPTAVLRFLEDWTISESIESLVDIDALIRQAARV